MDDVYKANEIIKNIKNKNIFHLNFEIAIRKICRNYGKEQRKNSTIKLQNERNLKLRFLTVYDAFVDFHDSERGYAMRQNLACCVYFCNSSVND